jgi:hypothetical protein
MHAQAALAGGAILRTDLNDETGEANAASQMRLTDTGI